MKRSFFIGLAIALAALVAVIYVLPPEGAHNACIRLPTLCRRSQAWSSMSETAPPG